jgi:two-component SAPR family response regulator
LTLSLRDDIDLLLTDIIMPGGMNGRQLAERALLVRPGLKVLFTSGYDNADVTDGSFPLSPDVMLRKPYRREDLMRFVAQRLALDMSAEEFGDETPNPDQSSFWRPVG